MNIYRSGNWVHWAGDASVTDQPNWWKITYDNVTIYDFYLVETDFEKYAVTFTCFGSNGTYTSE